MYAIYITDGSCERYTDYILSGAKTIETRNRDTLGKLVGKRVLIIRTGNPSRIVGSVVITGKAYHTAEGLDTMRDQTKIPLGSKYDPKPGAGKWCYSLSDPVRFAIPYRINSFMRKNSMVNHGRSYTEII